MKPRHGLIVPLITPLTVSLELDVPALGRLIEHVVAGGVDGLFVLGTTGEAPSLDMDLRRAALEHTVQLAPADLPVYVCITDASLENSLTMARWAADAGAAAVVAAPPFYFPIDDGELYNYYQSLCQRLPLPLMLYNMPAMTKVALRPQLVQRLADLPQVIGLKDSSGDLAAFIETLRCVSGRSDFAMFMGDERLIAEAVLAGASGGISGGANVAPELFSAVYAAARTGDPVATRRHQQRVLEFGSLYAIGRRWGRHIANLKYALSLMGICEPHLAAPLSVPSAAEQADIARWLERCRHGLSGDAMPRAQVISEHLTAWQALRLTVPRQPAPATQGAR